MNWSENVKPICPIVHLAWRTLIPKRESRPGKTTVAISFSHIIHNVQYPRAPAELICCEYNAKYTLIHRIIRDYTQTCIIHMMIITLWSCFHHCVSLMRLGGSHGVNIRLGQDDCFGKQNRLECIHEWRAEIAHGNRFKNLMGTLMTCHSYSRSHFHPRGYSEIEYQYVS